MSERDSSLSGLRDGGSSKFNAFSFIVAAVGVTALLLSVAAPAPAAQRGATTLQLNTAVAHRIELEGINLGEGSVRLESPLTARLDIVSSTGSQARSSEVRPGVLSHDELVITGPLPVPRDLVSWFEETIQSGTSHRAGSVVMVDRSGNELRRHNFLDAFPSELSVDVTTGRWRLGMALSRIEFMAR